MGSRERLPENVCYKLYAGIYVYGLDTYYMPAVLLYNGKTNNIVYRLKK